MNFLKVLAFWPKSYHVRYKQMDIIVPTKYVIDQQHIEILKNCDCLRRKFENVLIARNNLWNLKFQIAAHVVSTNMWYSIDKDYRVSDAKTEKIRLARFARSRKLPLTIITAKICNDNNCIESKLW